MVLGFFSGRTNGLVNSLASLFPLAYSLAFSKQASIESQGTFQGDIWHWRSILRRPIGEHERLQVQALHQLLDSANLSPSPVLDEVSWPLDRSGVFSVKSFYSFITDGGVRSSHSSTIWNNSFPSRVKFFLWLLSITKLNTKDRLIVKGWSGDPTCSLGSSKIETHNHLFLNYQFAQQGWDIFLPKIGIQSLSLLTYQCFDMCTDKYIEPAVRLLWRFGFSTICWVLWTARNNFIFNGVVSNPQQLASKIAYYLLFWTGLAASKRGLKLKAINRERGISDLIASSVDSDGEADNT